MARSLWYTAIHVGACALAVCLLLPPEKPSRQGLVRGDGSEATVLVLDAAGVYHCPGSRRYAHGGGTRMAECAAIREGYRPAFGTACGSPCLQAPTEATAQK